VEKTVLQMSISFSDEKRCSPTNKKKVLLKKGQEESTRKSAQLIIEIQCLVRHNMIQNHKKGL
jgi:hypothetical protein